jgi:D-alanyl-D-alanine endopeptidase (penicillin-binding protein 7)
MKRLIAVIIACSVFLTPHFAMAQTDGPVKDPNAHPYEFRAKEFAAAIVIDAKTGKVLYEYQADKPWSAASLTKLMSSLVFLDSPVNWNKVVTIQKEDEVGGGRLQVAAGATLKMIDMFYSSVTASANNAAMAVARLSGLSKTGFIQAMNKKAIALGMTNTTFVDPSGMEVENMTTARDMSKLANAAYNVDIIRRAATTGQYKFTIRNTGQVKLLKNTNDMLTAKAYDDYYVTGGKTGFLYESMYNLAIRVRPTGDLNANRQVIVVVFGSQTRDASFKSSAALANWAWKAHKW